MELLAQGVDLILHLDRHLGVFLAQYGTWIYALLFTIVFAETGLVVTPFLPGDSLLFVAGTLAATGGMDVRWLMAVLIAAALTGDNVNYWTGRILGPRVFRRDDSRWLNRNHLEYTRRFYERHGVKTIVLARFIPIIRTFAPFVAGIGHMPYLRFLTVSILAALLWVVSLVLAGYYFGNLAWVKQNLSLVILGIILLSISPGLIEYWRHRRRG
jgi:membrane-associated protein